MFSLYVHTRIMHCRYYAPAWEASSSPATLPQPRVSSESSPKQLDQASAATAAATPQHQNTLQNTVAPQGPAIPSSGQAVLQKQHLAAAKPVGWRPAPQAGSRQGQLRTDRSFYSFEVGGVHFLMLDTESPSEPGSPQGMFAASDLAKVSSNDGVRKWDWLAGATTCHVRGCRPCT